jgi:hypothetical protein
VGGRERAKVRRLTHTGLGLAENVHAEDSLRNALLLDCEWGRRGQSRVRRRRRLVNLASLAGEGTVVVETEALTRGLVGPLCGGPSRASAATPMKGTRRKSVLQLTLTRVLETQIRDGPQELGLEEEVAETGRVHTDVRALLVLALSGSGGSSIVGGTVGGSGGGDGGGEVVFFVVCLRG